jgi:hypothetical protein
MGKGNYCCFKKYVKNLRETTQVLDLSFDVNNEFSENFLNFMFMMDLSWVSLGSKNLLFI